MHSEQERNSLQFPTKHKTFQSHLSETSGKLMHKLTKNNNQYFHLCVYAAIPYNTRKLGQGKCEAT